MPTSPFTLPSFAKINWSLRVLGRRPDGYHEVRTVLQTISLHDRLHFSEQEDPGNQEIVLSCDDQSIPLGLDNLIVRAANALRDRHPVRSGVSIHLEKRIPTRGGLGGGSSNAAIALLGLARLWSLNLDSTELAKVGATIGADVPFFLLGGCALATGTGTDLAPLADSPDENARKHLVIVSPNAMVSTATAYESLKAPALTSLNGASILSISHAEEISGLTHQCEPHNDFEEVIFRSAPEIERAKESLLKVGATSCLLAGSGSSVFGIFENKQAQERAVNEIQAEIGWRVFPAVTISRREYLQEFGSCGVPLSLFE